MSNILDKSIKEIHELLINKKVTCKELVEEAIKRIEDSDLNAFITLNKEEAAELVKLLAQELENN